MTKRWTDAELRRQLDLWEVELARRGLSEATVQGYLDNVERFLRWRRGGYQPAGAARPAAGDARTAADPSTSAELTADVARYRAALETAGLRAGAIATYVRHVERFVKRIVPRPVRATPKRERAG